MFRSEIVFLRWDLFFAIVFIIPLRLSHYRPLIAFVKNHKLQTIKIRTAEPDFSTLPNTHTLIKILFCEGGCRSILWDTIKFVENLSYLLGIILINKLKHTMAYRVILLKTILRLSIIQLMQESYQSAWIYLN